MGRSRQQSRSEVGPMEKLPALAAYRDRIGAQLKSFRRADVLEMQGGYPKVVGSIRLNQDGSITCTEGIDPPTADEATAIAEEYKLADLPKAVTLSALGNDLPAGVILDGIQGYVCHDFEGRIVMLQQRVELPDGKAYVPWTYFSDGEWRRMEPEGGLPFYGLDRAKNSSSTLFIHEGAKAAAHLQRLVDGTAPGTSSALPWETDGEAPEPEAGQGFPWLEEMRWGCHVGWLGGVHALARSDWASLAKLPWKRVVIVADNDAVGRAVVPRIAEYFRCPTYAITWSNEWPEHFDLADRWPTTMFSPEGHYLGPSLPAMLQPATWATDPIQVIGDNGRPKTIFVPRPAFVSQWALVIDNQQVASVDDPSKFYSKEQFNDAVRAFSHVKDTYGLLTASNGAVCFAPTYRPDLPPGPVIENGQPNWNSFQPSLLKAIAGDVAPFLDFIAHLFPLEADRVAVLRWLATLFAKRNVRMRYSLLLISSTQGIGKSTLGLIIKLLLGESNVSFPSETSIAESAFNSWAGSKLAIVANEIYSNSNKKVYDKLKSIVTDDHIEINEKYQKPYTLPNWAVIFACSNSQKALYIPEDDRRWLIPTLTKQLKPPEYWDDFYAWLAADGAGIIRHWAEQFVLQDWVRTGERAPPSSAKDAIIASSKSEGRLIARDVGEELAGIAERHIITAAELVRHVARKRGLTADSSQLEKERTLLDELSAVEGLTILKGDKRPKIGGRRGAKASVILNFQPGADETWAQLEKHLTTLDEIGFGDVF